MEIATAADDASVLPTGFLSSSPPFHCRTNSLQTAKMPSYTTYIHKEKDADALVQCTVSILYRL